MKDVMLNFTISRFKDKDNYLCWKASKNLLKIKSYNIYLCTDKYKNTLKKKSEFIDFANEKIIAYLYRHKTDKAILFNYELKEKYKRAHNRS